jgi:hypothetical protein
MLRESLAELSPKVSAVSSLNLTCHCILSYTECVDFIVAATTAERMTYMQATNSLLDFGVAPGAGALHGAGAALQQDAIAMMGSVCLMMGVDFASMLAGASPAAMIGSLCCLECCMRSLINRLANAMIASALSDCARASALKYIEDNPGMSLEMRKKRHRCIILGLSGLIYAMRA